MKKIPSNYILKNLQKVNLKMIFYLFVCLFLTTACEKGVTEYRETFHVEHILGKDAGLYSDEHIWNILDSVSDEGAMISLYDGEDANPANCVDNDPFTLETLETYNNGTLNDVDYFFVIKKYDNITLPIASGRMTID